MLYLQTFNLLLNWNEFQCGNDQLRQTSLQDAMSLRNAIRARFRNADKSERGGGPTGVGATGCGGSISVSGSIGEEKEKDKEKDEEISSAPSATMTPAVNSSNRKISRPGKMNIPKDEEDASVWNFLHFYFLFCFFLSFIHDFMNAVYMNQIGVLFTLMPDFTIFWFFDIPTFVRCFVLNSVVVSVNQTQPFI